MSPAESVKQSFASAFNTLSQNAANATSYLFASPKDLVLFFPRAAARAGSFISDIPNAFENILESSLASRVIAEANAERGGLYSIMNAGGAAMAEGGLEEGAARNVGFIQSFAFQQVRTFGGIFSYLMSKWAIGCFTAGIIINRTSIYASARRHLRLNWQLRAALRMVPIYLCLGASLSLLQAMRCQTSPDYSLLRYGAAGEHEDIDFSGDGGLLYTLSSRVLFWESTKQSCLASRMIAADPKSDEIPIGSLHLLWPSFQTFALNSFVETLSSALQGLPVTTETGMSLFEHSLAFAEAEAMVTANLGLGPYRNSSLASGGLSMAKRTETAEATIEVTKGFLSSRFNTTPEMLLVTLISSLNNLSTQILGVFGIQSKFRLINTGIWGLGFMACFIWGFFTYNIEEAATSGIFRFPKVCVVGFVPHTVILLGICLCACIYALALLITILSPPESFPRGISWKERIKLAHGNMQANIPLSGLRLNMREDFYSALLRVGFTALTAASEAVYLNEGRRVNVGHWTWLEEERMDEVARSRSNSNLAPAFEDSDLSQIVGGAAMSSPEDQTQLLPDNSQWTSGYTRERNTKLLKSSIGVHRANNSAGATQRSGRYILAFSFLSRIFWLVTGWAMLFMLKVMRKMGIQRRPRWLDTLLTKHRRAVQQSKSTVERSRRELDFWLLTDDGELMLPQSLDVDVEAETKKRLALSNNGWGLEEEQELDSNLYSWFTHGGWWGEKDESGDYEPSARDDDLTSLLSFSSSVATDDKASVSDFGGRRTPTQSNPYPASSAGRSRESTPAANDNAIDPAHLAELLNPQSEQARSEARMLAAHLRSPRPLTRARYRGDKLRAESRVLTSSRHHRPPGFAPAHPSGKLSAAEEAEVLEYLILKQREGAGGGGGGGADGPGGAARSRWDDGADGLGSGGPLCVVCQSSPRTILAWPCRCLSLCEECRVSLAMNNFATCVCCRQEVVGFSRLYVP